MPCFRRPGESLNVSRSRRRGDDAAGLVVRGRFGGGHNHRREDGRAGAGNDDDFAHEIGNVFDLKGQLWRESLADSGQESTHHNNHAEMGVVKLDVSIAATIGNCTMPLIVRTGGRVRMLTLNRHEATFEFEDDYR